MNTPSLQVLLITHDHQHCNAGSYTPEDPRKKHTHSSGPGSAPFCTTGRSLQAVSAASHSASTSVGPGPGAHGVPQVDGTGASLQWGRQTGAGAVFLAPPRTAMASAASLREQLQRQKYADGQPVPWLLAPPQHTGGRPLPGPRAQRQVQSAHAGSSSSSSRALQDRPQRAAARSALGSTSSVLRQGVATAGTAKQPDLQPGPGSYELLKYGALRHSVGSTFSRPLVQDRFGAPARPATHRQQQHQPQPQPQQQDSSALHPPAAGRHTSSLVGSRQPGVSAGFRSRSPGHSQALLAASDAAMVGAPGPSYYSPLQPPHKVSYRQAPSARTFVAAV